MYEFCTKSNCHIFLPFIFLIEICCQSCQKCQRCLPVGLFNYLSEIILNIFYIFIYSIIKCPVFEPIFYFFSHQVYLLLIDEKTLILKFKSEVLTFSGFSMGSNFAKVQFLQKKSLFLGYQAIPMFFHRWIIFLIDPF